MFLSMSDKPWLDQLKVIQLLVQSWYKPLWIFPSVQGRENTNKEGEIRYDKNKYEASATSQAHFSNIASILQIFVRHLPR